MYYCRVDYKRFDEIKSYLFGIMGQGQAKNTQEKPWQEDQKSMISSDSLEHWHDKAFAKWDSVFKGGPVSPGCSVVCIIISILLVLVAGVLIWWSTATDGFNCKWSNIKQFGCPDEEEFGDISKDIHKYTPFGCSSGKVLDKQGRIKKRKKGCDEYCYNFAQTEAQKDSGFPFAEKLKKNKSIPCNKNKGICGHCQENEDECGCTVGPATCLNDVTGQMEPISCGIEDEEGMGGGECSYTEENEFGNTCPIYSKEYSIYLGNH